MRGIHRDALGDRQAIVGEQHLSLVFVQIHDFRLTFRLTMWIAPASHAKRCFVQRFRQRGVGEHREPKSSALASNSMAMTPRQ